jgi:UDP-N-acetylmuramoylalanine--D-glutamate ligase
VASRSVLVAGGRVTGASVALALRDRGTAVTVCDRTRTAQAAELEAAGIPYLVDENPPVDGYDQLVVSPGIRPDHPLVTAARAARVEVLGDVELAWRLRRPGTTWLALTGTNGKTTTVRMLAAMLAAAGRDAVAAGNVGLPLLDAVLAGHEVLAVELSSFQLHWTSTLAVHAGAVLNLAPDHLDWHGSMAAYVEAKARIWHGAGWCVGNADDAAVMELLGTTSGRTLTFTLRDPEPGQYGVRDGHLVGAAGEPLIAAAEVRPAGPHNIANALAAAALASTCGVPAEAVAAGLRAFHPDPHRNETVATIGGVTWVDDSKATNPHAAAASLSAYPSVVWVAGGLLKGASVDQLVADHAHRLAGAVLLGADRAAIAEAIARHAPDVPVVEVSRADDGAMAEVVRAAGGLARAGDVVLLAPAAASVDMFRDYAARGDAFVTAVRRLGSP